jgi:mannose-6-phosphate isomerase-like protein (cupin superfamily)
LRFVRDRVENVLKVMVKGVTASRRGKPARGSSQPWETVTLTKARSAARSVPSDNPRAHWPPELQRDYEANRFSGCVGSVLVSETDRVRVWHLTIPPGKRCNFHRHVLNYFWTALNGGKARNFYEDGTQSDASYFKGQTQHMTFAKGEYMVHALENTGETDLLFATVEFLDSPNRPLPVADAMRLEAPQDDPRVLP